MLKKRLFLGPAAHDLGPLHRPVNRAGRGCYRARGFHGTGEGPRLGADRCREGLAAAPRFRAQLRPAALLPPVHRGWLRLGGR